MQPYGRFATLGMNRRTNFLDRLRRRLGDGQDLLRLTFGFIDQLLHITLGDVNGFRHHAFRDIDARLLVTEAFRQDGAFFPLGGDLPLHRLIDAGRGQDVFNFEAQDANTPGTTGGIEYLNDLGADQVTLFKGAFQIQGTNHRTGRGTRQLHGRIHIIDDAIGGFARVFDRQVDHTIDLQVNLILRKTILRRHIDSHFFQVDAIGNLIDERYDGVKAGFQRALIAAKTLNNEGHLGRHEIERTEKLEDHRYKDDRPNRDVKRICY